MSVDVIKQVEGSCSCVFFDFDGTLADTLLGITSTARKTLLEFGFTEDELGDLTRLVGPPFPHAFMQIYGLSEADACEVTRRYRNHYEQFEPSAWPPFDGVIEMLDTLRSHGKVLGIVSAKQHDVVMRCATDHGFEKHVDLILGKTEDTQSTKAASIASAMNELGVDANACVMVGDREGDVSAALANDIPCVGVTYGGTGTKKELQDAGAVVIVDSIPELKMVLLGM